MESWALFWTRHNQLEWACRSHNSPHRRVDEVSCMKPGCFNSPSLVTDEWRSWAAFRQRAKWIVAVRTPSQQLTPHQLYANACVGLFVFSLWLNSALVGDSASSCLPPVFPSSSSLLAHSRCSCKLQRSTLCSPPACKQLTSSSGCSDAGRSNAFIICSALLYQSCPACSSCVRASLSARTRRCFTTHVLFVRYFHEVFQTAPTSQTWPRGWVQWLQLVWGKELKSGRRDQTWFSTRLWTCYSAVLKD